MELLAPAGGPEQLAAALHFGADAVYLSLPRWGMRRASEGFGPDALADAVARAHAAGARVHLAVNTLMTDDDIDELPRALASAQEAGVDAAIMSDLGALSVLRRHAPRVEAHLSTQASCMNAAAADAYARLGVRRVVLAREMTLAQVAELRRRATRELELEAFAHGSLCMAVSGRCLLSAELAGPRRSASFGACAQPCRWEWSVAERRSPEGRVDVACDGRWSYLLSSNDLCMVEHLGEIEAAGVDAIKLEGRAKGAYYVAAVTNAYRHALDGWDVGPWRHELDLVSHRPYSTGFYLGEPTQNPGHEDYVRERRMVGVVAGPASAAAPAPPAPAGDGCVRHLVEVECRNRAAVGEGLDVLSPGEPVRHVTLDEAWELSEGAGWVATEGLARSMGRYLVALPWPLAPGDLLCARG